MKVRQLSIDNFRGVKHGEVHFEDHTLLVGGNNVGKSTVCEALDLVLGPERLNRRPIVDEHDFHKGIYIDPDTEDPIEIRITAVLVDLDVTQLRRFQSHLRRWDSATDTFIDDEPGGLAVADEPGVVWALPVIFFGRFDIEEDDFVGGTFFEHPAPAPGEFDDEQHARLGGGRAHFDVRSKRMCGFVFLRTLRTGSRALSLQRGSLLDTISRLAGEGSAEMWEQTLDSLRELDPAVGDISTLKAMRSQIREQMSQFINLGASDNATAFFASDLTRQHLRDVVRLFVATRPSEHPVPFARQGTGSINMLVFALLTIIAELKGKKSVIFAMEEPEIALPPHTQRRVTRFVLHEMGQSIVTSHSPYVIEQFEPSDVVMIHNSGEALTSAQIDAGSLKSKTYQLKRRQFAEAILSRAVLVVEGSTEIGVFSSASSALERLGAEGYLHVDLAGISLFDADGDKDVPKYAPIFKAMGKRTYGAWDKQTADFDANAKARIAMFDAHWEATETGIERVLVTQTTTGVLRRFLGEVVNRDDYPRHLAYSELTPDDELEQIAYEVLKARKGEAAAYASSLLDHCQAIEEVPMFLRDVLRTIDEDLRPPGEGQAEGRDGSEPGESQFDDTP